MVTVGTWNLENLFGPGSEAGPDSDAVYGAKLTALAETITTLAPDVLAVQEVGEPEALADLVDRFGGTWHTALAEPDGRGIRSACCPAWPSAICTPDTIALSTPPKAPATMVADPGGHGQPGRA